MSYNNNGRVPIENLKSKFDKIYLFSHKSNAMKNMTTNKKWINQKYNTKNEEYLLVKEIDPITKRNKNKTFSALDIFF